MKNEILKFEFVINHVHNMDIGVINYFKNVNNFIYFEDMYNNATSEDDKTFAGACLCTFASIYNYMISKSNFFFDSAKITCFKEFKKEHFDDRRDEYLKCLYNYIKQLCSNSKIDYEDINIIVINYKFLYNNKDIDFFDILQNNIDKFVFNYSFLLELDNDKFEHKNFYNDLVKINFDCIVSINFLYNFIKKLINNKMFDYDILDSVINKMHFYLFDISFYYFKELSKLLNLLLKESKYYNVLSRCLEFNKRVCKSKNKKIFDSILGGIKIYYFDTYTFINDLICNNKICLVELKKSDLEYFKIPDFKSDVFSYSSFLDIESSFSFDITPDFYPEYFNFTDVEYVYNIFIDYIFQMLDDFRLKKPELLKLIFYNNSNSNNKFIKLVINCIKIQKLGYKLRVNDEVSFKEVLKKLLYSIKPNDKTDDESKNESSEEVVNGLLFVCLLFLDTNCLNLRNNTFHGDLIGEDVDVLLILSYVALFFLNLLVNGFYDSESEIVLINDVEIANEYENLFYIFPFIERITFDISYLNHDSCIWQPSSNSFGSMSLFVDNDWMPEDLKEILSKYYCDSDGKIAIRNALFDFDKCNVILDGSTVDYNELNDAIVNLLKIYIKSLQHFYNKFVKKK